MADPHETVTTEEIPDGSPSSPVDLKGGGEKEGASDAPKPAEDDNGKTRAPPQPQAQPLGPSPSRQESMETVYSRAGSLEDCHLTPLVDQNLKKPPAGGGQTTIASPPLYNNGHDGDPGLDRPSSLHRDEYAQDDDQHRPHRHESALEGVRSMTGWERQPSFDSRQRKTKDKRGRKTGGRLHFHSNPRKSPYRSEVARIRHAQRLERQGQGNHGHGAPPSSADDASHTIASSRGRTISLKQTTAPPPTSSFAVQSARFKHAILNSLGEFLTSAFADDEEASGSYFSQDLLDQLAASDPRLRGVWLQAKNLDDNHVRQLCEALVTNKVVTEVWLPSNSITDVGAAHLAHMLKFNKSIRELFLGGNDIGPRGAAALAAALARGNATLVALGLGDNHIGVEGAGALAAALRHNHSLHTLDVKGNGIPRRSSVRRLLSKMLEFNASDPGDESLVLGLQDELASLVSRMSPKEAEAVVLRAEGALTAAMACRKRGDKVGAAEAEGAFIRICTTGAPPADPPEREGSGGSAVAREEKGRAQREPRVADAADCKQDTWGRGRDAPEGNNGAGNNKERGLPQQDDEVEQEEKGKEVVREREAAEDEALRPLHEDDEMEQEEEGREAVGEVATAKDVSGINELDKPERKDNGLQHEEGEAELEEKSKEGGGLAAGERRTPEEEETEATDKPAAAVIEASQEEEVREGEVR